MSMLYLLSYVCRRDVQDVGYQHFCQHFRPLGGACTLCDKCGLYDKEDEEQGSLFTLPTDVKPSRKPVYMQLRNTLLVILKVVP